MFESLDFEHGDKCLVELRRDMLMMKKTLKRRRQVINKAHNFLQNIYNII